MQFWPYLSPSCIRNPVISSPHRTAWLQHFILANPHRLTGNLRADLQQRFLAALTMISTQFVQSFLTPTVNHNPIQQLDSFSAPSWEFLTEILAARGQAEQLPPILAHLESYTTESQWTKTEQSARLVWQALALQLAEKTENLVLADQLAKQIVSNYHSMILVS